MLRKREKFPRVRSREDQLVNYIASNNPPPRVERKGVTDSYCLKTHHVPSVAFSFTGPRYQLELMTDES